MDRMSGTATLHDGVVAPSGGEDFELVERSA
jgi:hypothetical protein